MNILLQTLIILVFLLLMSVVVLVVVHKRALHKESTLYPALGKLVEIDNKRFHVFVKGNNKKTIVFLAGHGTSSPTLDFKPLWSRLVSDFTIVVIERPGYGWSDSSASDKSIDTLLEHSRQCLSMCNISGPYTLVAHSMSGLEALYWAQKYPLEVNAIIGLDPCVPDAVQLLPIPSTFKLRMMYWMAMIGVPRLMPKSQIKTTFPLLNLSELDETEQQQYMHIFHRNGFSKDMLKEVYSLHANATVVNNYDIPAFVPAYFFMSNEQNNNILGWENAMTSYLSNFNTKHFVKLDTHHYVHYIHADFICSEIKRFMHENLPM